MASVPIPHLPRALWSVPMWLREIVLLAGLYGFYEVVRGLHHGTLQAAARNGHDILAWERGLHLDPEGVLTRYLAHTTALAVPSAYFYSTMHYLVTPVVMVWMYRSHRSHYRSARTSLVIGTALGLVLFWLVPTEPPRLLAGANVPDVLAGLRNWGWWGGDGSVPRGMGGITNQLAAMPSLHVGWALWSGFLLARFARRRTVRVLGAIYPVLTTFVVLATGNHYLLDVLAGAGVMVAGTFAALEAKKAVRALRAASERRARPSVVEAVLELDQRPGALVVASRGA